VLLGEELLLMSLDVVSGIPAPGLEVIHREAFLSACLLAELAVQKQVGLTPDGVRLLDKLPDYHTLLSEAVLALKRSPTANPADAIRRISHALPDLRDRHLDSLVSRDLLHEAGRRRFLIAGARSYPVRSTRARNEAFAHLAEAAAGRCNSMRGMAMLLLADAVAATLRLLPETEANAAGIRAAALARETREALPANRDWTTTQSASALIVGVAEALPHLV